VRLIADEVRGSVREAMKSLRADLAASAQSERDNAERDRDDARASASASGWTRRGRRRASR
jgi:hypothetical protein